MLIILRLQSYNTSTHTNCLIQLLKSGWLRSFVSTEARILQRLLYLSSGYLRSFKSFLINFNHLRFVRLGVSRQREANSTALQLAVNCLFTAVDSSI